MSELVREEVHAVVFDCDGTLLDTERLWRQAERDFLTGLGGVYRDELAQLMLGRSVPDGALLLAGEAGVAMPRESAGEALLERFTGVVRGERIELMPGAAELVRELSREEVPLAVASNTPSPCLEQLLERAGLLEYFQVVVGAGGAFAPKPGPDVYLHAVQVLGQPPERSLALEDSQIGVDAALAAGLAVIGVNSDPRVRLRGCRQVPSLAALPWPQLRRETPGGGAAAPK